MNEANLRMIHDFKERYGVVPGLSDHTLGHVAPIVAVTQGAKVIEKHLILDKKNWRPRCQFFTNREGI